MMANKSLAVNTPYLFLLFLLLGVSIVSGAYVGESCESDGDCYGSPSTCEQGICVCPPGQSPCAILGSHYYKCYNASAEVCCPGNYETAGTFCALGSSCCPGQYTTCYDAETEYCCPESMGRTACNLADECCGDSCYTNGTGQCCYCDYYTKFTCAADDICYCDEHYNMKCIPSEPKCSHEKCGGTDSCCPDRVIGEVCYSNTTHNCLYDLDREEFHLCSISDHICNGTCFNPQQATCAKDYQGNNKLCGAHESNCLGQCYDPNHSVCIGNVLCPSGNSYCGDVKQCYNTTTHTCTYDYGIGNRVCAISEGACAGGCYSRSTHQCCYNGWVTYLKPKTESC